MARNNIMPLKDYSIIFKAWSTAIQSQIIKFLHVQNASNISVRMMGNQGTIIYSHTVPKTKCRVFSEKDFPELTEIREGLTQLRRLSIQFAQFQKMLKAKIRDPYMFHKVMITKVLPSGFCNFLEYTDDGRKVTPSYLEFMTEMIGDAHSEVIDSYPDMKEGLSTALAYWMLQ